MNICVRINGLSIDRVYNTTFLGVMIDDKLNWKEHITMIQSTFSKTTDIIYKASHVLTERALYNNNNNNNNNKILFQTIYIHTCTMCP